MAPEFQFHAPQIGLVTIRHARGEEAGAIQHFVQKIADTIYGGLLAGAPVPLGETNWSQAWLAYSDGELVAVLNTAKEWVDDLWIAQRARRAGLGIKLMNLAEQEIRDRGFSTGRLAVVSSNQAAISFYTACGWMEVRQSPHASLPTLMTEMHKALNA